MDAAICYLETDNFYGTMANIWAIVINQYECIEKWRI